MTPMPTGNTHETYKYSLNDSGNNTSIKGLLPLILEVNLWLIEFPIELRAPINMDL